MKSKQKRWLLLMTVMLAPLLAHDVTGMTTINSGDRYAYSANAGWLDARGDGANGAVIGQAYCSGYIWSANCGWIKLGAGTPTNGWRYGNESADDWGVNHDGEGDLFGQAYGANIGWITFEQTHGQPRIDLLTGSLSGYAWGANIGWISLSNAQAFVRTDFLDAGPDSDGDGIPDWWEYKMAGNLTTLHGGGHDADGDGASDLAEFLADTDPLDDESYLALYHVADDEGERMFGWPTAMTRLYQLETSTNLLTGAFVGSDLGVLAPYAPIMVGQVEIPETDSVYYRVKVITPLSGP